MSNENEQIVLGGKADEIVKCADCGKELKVEERHSFEGNDGEDIYYCDECLAKINQAFEEETKNPNILFALVSSIIAGILGGLAWYWITVITNLQVGYLAIALGWLIAFATCKGAGNKKGKLLQVIAVLVTLVTLLFSDFMISLHYVGDSLGDTMSSIDAFKYFLEKGFHPILIFIVVLKNTISPIGLVIWGVGLYTAYVIPKARKL